MDTSGVIQLVSIVILIFLSGFFSSAETALSTVNRVRMRTLEEEGSKRAARVNKVLDNYSKMISTILIGNNIVNLTASSLATTLAMRINLAVGIATGVLTIVVLLCGEIVPSDIERNTFRKPSAYRNLWQNQQWKILIYQYFFLTESIDCCGCCRNYHRSCI